MLRSVAQLLSYLFHPLLMPTILFGMLMIFFPLSITPPQAWLLVMSLIFGMTFILPLLNLLFFKLTGTLQNLHMPEQKDRILPFIFISIVYAGITAMIFWKMNFPIVFNLMVIITGLVIVATIATFFMKISVHAMASSGIVGILLAIVSISSVGELLIPTLLMLVIAGAVMSSRLLLNAHDSREIGWGGAVGFMIGFAGTSILF